MDALPPPPGYRSRSFSKAIHAVPDDSQLLAVVIGAAAGISGQLLTQLFGHLTSMIDRRYSRLSKNRERLEEMSELVTSSLEWLQTIPAANSLELVVSSKPPLKCRRIVTLASLYFPDLVDPATEYCNSLIQHYQFCLSLYNPHIPAPLGAQVELAIQRSDDPDKLRTTQMQPLRLRQLLDDAIAIHAKKYMHT